MFLSSFGADYSTLCAILYLVMPLSIANAAPEDVRKCYSMDVSEKTACELRGRERAVITRCEWRDRSRYPVSEQLMVPRVWDADFANAFVGTESHGFSRIEGSPAQSVSVKEAGGLKANISSGAYRRQLQKEKAKKPDGVFNVANIGDLLDDGGGMNPLDLMATGK